MALWLTLALMSAGLPPTSADAGRAFLRDYGATRKFTAGVPVQAKPTPDGSAVVFLRSPPTSSVQSLYETDVATGKTRELLAPERVPGGAGADLSPAEQARLERQRVSARGFTSFTLSQDGRWVLTALAGHPYLVERATGRVTPVPTPGGASVLDPQLSPDGTQVAYVRDNDLRVVPARGGPERAVTRGGSARLTHGLAEFIAQEEMSRFTGFWWSPDGSQLAYEEADHAGMERFDISDPLAPDRGARGFFYPRAGRPNAKVRLGLVSVRGGATTWVQWDAARFPYLATVRWPKRGALTVLVQSRSQTEQQLLAVNPATGKTRVLLEEKDAAWLTLDQRFPAWLPDGSGFFWRADAAQGVAVELRRADGSLRGAWVRPEDGFEALLGFEEATGSLYFSGAPLPTEANLYAVQEGGRPARVPLGPTEPGYLKLGELSGAGGLVVAQVQSAKAMPRVLARRLSDGKTVELPSVAQPPPFGVQVELRQVGPGEGFWTSVVRPRGFRPGQKLPVIVEVYGGPTHAMVKQTMGDRLLSQWLADQGFLVVQIDNRGTPRRNHAFERAVKNDLGTFAVDDQAAALQALAAQVPELDLSRVGIYGWSFGGYLAALATMKRPDLYKAGVAGAPVVDWADYDTHYTERYLGTPAENPGGYQQSSLLTWADRLERPLLLIHGTADDNVYFFHTLKLSDALFRAGKPHEVLPLANFTHMVPDPLVTERLYERIARHFREALVPSPGPTPPRSMPSAPAR